MIQALRTATPAFDPAHVHAWGDQKARQVAPEGPASQDTTWFWEIVDRHGLADVPSDERGALALLCERTARAHAPAQGAADPAGLEAKLRMFGAAERAQARAEEAGDEEAADRADNRHAARFVALGLWTGTRHDAILALGWHQHLGGGWADVDRGVLYRAAPRAAQTKKKKPPAPLPARLLRMMRRWRRLDGDGLHIVSWQGERIAKMRRAFGTAVRLAGLGDDVTPHVLRHTCTTWLVQSGTPLWEVAGYVGMTVEMVERVYGHHAPDHLQRAVGALR